MKKSAINILLALIGFIFIAVTLCGFFLFGYDKTTSDYVGLGFCLLSEILLFAGIVYADKIDVTNKVFLKSGLMSLLILYFLAAAVLFLVSGAFSEHIKLMVFIEIAALALTMLFAIIIRYFSSKIGGSDENINQSRKLMQICARRIYALLSDGKNTDYKDMLNALYEKFKYMDNIATTLADERIVGEIIKFEKVIGAKEKNDDKIKDAYSGIMKLIAQREIELAELKRGGF